MRRSILTSSALAGVLIVVAVSVASVWVSVRRVVAAGDAELGGWQGRILYNEQITFLRSGRKGEEWRVRVDLRAGFAPLPAFDRDPYLGTFIAIPLWPVAFVFAAVAFVSHRRITKGACKHCRYNLSGLPPSSPCPECGSPRPS